ncbi:MAG: PAS domain-containing protein [Alphaproteobacteria bacterium]|nr:PAS domain-containing protein [Alphaproteobacteria bacterium]
MIKRKVKKTPFYFFRFLARIFVLNLPIIIALIFLIFLGKVNLLTAFYFFIAFFLLSVVWTIYVFHEQEQFINYLKDLSQGRDVDLPHVHKGIFGSFRLADAFLSVKHRWSNQTISADRILENLPHPLFLINENANIVFANKMGRNFFGDEILHQPLHSFFKESDFVFAFEQLIGEKSKQEWFEWDFEDDCFYSFQVRFEKLPAPARNGGIIVMVMHDITQLKLFKQQQADFFANASHELKTPLSVLSGFIETLQGAAKDDETAREKFLNLMAEQTERMTNLVQDLLVLSKLQMTEKNNQKDVILIWDLLQSVIDSLELKAAARHKKIELKLVHDIPRLIGNKTELIHVFQNLIDNAIKYGEDNSVITIRAELKAGFPRKSDKYFSDMRQVVLVSVHNTGNPIAPQDITRLFERFYRVDNFKSRGVEGTGLGLGIAQQIVNAHDGLITVQSSLKKGTSFNVYLPIDF